MVRPKVSDEQRKEAQDLVIKHGSLAKASAATGVPKSTLAFRVAGSTSSPVLNRTLNDVPQGEDIGQTGDGNPGDTTVTQTAPTTGIDATAEWRPTSELAIRSLMRYVSGLANGSQPHHAMRAAQAVDPDFDISLQQHTLLLDALSKATLSEKIAFGGLAYAGNPPPYVRRVFDEFAWSDADEAELTDIIASIRQAAYAQAITDEFTRLGAGRTANLSDPEVLRKIRLGAEHTAQGIVNTFNRDLASATGTAWLDLVAVEGRQMSAQKLRDAIEAWLANREQWKSEQIVLSEAAQGYNDGQRAFYDNNQIVEQEAFTPTDAQCPLCVDAVGMGWQEPGVLPDPPLHPNCIHSLDYRTAMLSDFSSLWDGSAISADELIADLG